MTWIVMMMKDRRNGVGVNVHLLCSWISYPPDECLSSLRTRQRQMGKSNLLQGIADYPHIYSAEMTFHEVETTKASTRAMEQAMNCKVFPTCCIEAHSYSCVRTSNLPLSSCQRHLEQSPFHLLGQSIMISSEWEPRYPTLELPRRPVDNGWIAFWAPGLQRRSGYLVGRCHKLFFHSGLYHLNRGVK